MFALVEGKYVQFLPESMKICVIYQVSRRFFYLGLLTIVQAH